MTPFIISQCFGLAAQTLEAEDCTVAFTNVNVVTMKNEHIRENQTVIITGSEISQIKSASDVHTSKCETVIEGDGRFLMPGLNDLHTHLETTAFDKAFGNNTSIINYDDVLLPYLANGITGLRILSGAQDILDARNRINSENVPLPRLVVSSPMLTGLSFILPEPMTSMVTTAEEGRKAVRLYAEQGYDLIKIRRNLSGETYNAVLEEAKRLGIDVDGHMPARLERSVVSIVTGGQRGFAHANEVAGKITTEQPDRNELINQLAKCDCYYSSTLAIFNNIYRQLDDFESLQNRSNARYMHPQWKQGFWVKAKNPYLKEKPPKAIFPKIAKDTGSFIKDLYLAGGVVLAGSDSLNPMILPGIGLHQELKALSEIGLTPFQVLNTSTRNASVAIRQMADVGTIEVGKTANLLLLKTNPLENMSELNNADFVVVGGHVLARSELDHRMTELANRYGDAQ